MLRVTGEAVALGGGHDQAVHDRQTPACQFFAKTGPDGLATIGNLPAGVYQLRVWHPDMEQNEQATLKQSSLGTKPVTAEWLLSLKPVFSIPRPLCGQGVGYH